jgi:hypothetical protein
LLRILTGAALVLLGVAAWLWTAQWVARDYLGPFERHEAVVDVAQADSAQGGTGVRGGGTLLSILIEQRLSPTPYQPAFTLDPDRYGSRAYGLAKRLPRGTRVVMQYRRQDLDRALAYAARRHAREQAGEVVSGVHISPPWQVPLARLDWRERTEGETRAVTVERSRAAVWFWALFVSVVGVGCVGAGARAMAGRPSLPGNPGDDQGSGANTP